MLSIDSLQNTFAELPASEPIYIAYSGGLDSHVLLHILAQAKGSHSLLLHSIHVNHNFHGSSGDWAEHCRTTSEALSVEYHGLVIDDKPPPGESIEAWAREKRYRLMTGLIPDNGILLTAHHMDDQAETLLLQLFRGAGVSGLAGMPLIGRRSPIIHARPLLEFTREELFEYALHHKLRWIEDESNTDTSFDRNFIRHEVLPLLKQRWPSLPRALYRVTEHQAEAMTLLDKIARDDLELLLVKPGAALSVPNLLSLDEARQSNVLIRWIKQRDLPAPASVHIEKIKHGLLRAKEDRMPLVSWPGCEVRRYQGHIYASEPLQVHDNSVNLPWLLGDPCHTGNGKLTASRKKGVGVKTECCVNEQLEVRFRQGGEKIRLPRKQHSQDLKKLFQEAGVPPWLRDRIPLLYSGDRLVAVADMWIDARSQSSAEEVSWHLIWQPDNNISSIICARRES